MHERDDGRPGRRLGLRPFAGVRFVGTPEEVLGRTADPPDSWAEVAPPAAGGVMDLLGPGFAGRVVEPAPWARWFAAGHVHRDDPSLYVYRRSGPWGATRGLLGVLDLAGGTSAPLLPHEEVHPRLVEAQRAVTAAIRAQVDPVVAVAERPRGASGRSPLARVLAEVTQGPADWTSSDGGSDGGTLHELWLLRDPDLVDRASRVPVGPVVVADGHHRRVAWGRGGDGSSDGWGLVWVVDATDEALRLDAVHRVCPGLSAETVLRSGLVDAEPLADEVHARQVLHESEGPACVLVSGGGFTLLRPGAGAPPPRCTLPDHALCWLHQVWLPAWGVAPEAVEHVHGVDAAVRRSDAGTGVGFLLPAPALDDVVGGALRGTPLPAKATSFTPKPRMGLVMRHWDAVADDVPTAGTARTVLPPAAGTA